VLTAVINQVTQLLTCQMNERAHKLQWQQPYKRPRMLQNRVDSDCGPPVADE